MFGAEANYGSVDCCPKWPPPGNRLFLELLARGGFTAKLTPELRRLFEKDFEKGMGKFIETQSIDIHVVLREMSEYFVPFTPGHNNGQCLVVCGFQVRREALEPREASVRA